MSDRVAHLHRLITVARLLLFRSEDVDHEVLPSFAPRFAFTCWFYGGSASAACAQSFLQDLPLVRGHPPARNAPSAARALAHNIPLEVLLHAPRVQPCPLHGVPPPEHLAALERSYLPLVQQTPPSADAGCPIHLRGAQELPRSPARPHARVRQQTPAPQESLKF